MNKVEQLQALFENMEVIDLTHTLEEGIPKWPSHATYAFDNVSSFAKGDRASHYQVTMSEHSGTHVDAPNHFIAEGSANYGIERVPLSTFSGRAVTINATETGKLGLLTKEKIIAWELEHGAIQAGDIVLVYFGWDTYWKTDPSAFLNDWPGVGKEASNYFVEKKVKMVGTDVLAIDVFDSEDTPAHYTLLGNEVLIMENLKNLDKLPPYSYFMGFPLKIKDGTGSPIRAISYV